MAWYDNNKNWAKEAVELALDKLSSEQESLYDLTKTAADIGIGAGTIIGGLIGAGVGRKAVTDMKDQEYKNLYGNAVQRVINEQNRKLVEMSQDHYQQINNLDRDLKVIFTPFSVVYMLRGTAVETIASSTMNAAMKQAWRNKDAQYFKNMLVNKMYLEAQEVEQLFIKRLIEQDNFLKDSINKRSSDYNIVDDEDDLDTHLFTMLDKQAYLEDLLSCGKSEVLDKYANLLVNTSIDNWDNISVPIEIGTYRYASDLDFDLGMQKLSFLFFGNNKNKVNMDVITPRNIKKDLSVVYLPDRVLFVTNDIVISQLGILGMNEEGYEKFQNKDTKYFRQNFFREAKQAGYEIDDLLEKIAFEEDDFSSIDSKASKMPYNEFNSNNDMYGYDRDNRLTTEAVEGSFFKIASEEALADKNPVIKELFTKSGIHPKIYYLVLMKKFNSEWLEWDLETLISMIKDNFDIEEIAEVPFNKLGSLVVLMHNDSPYTGYHTFEKVIRSFHDKPIDFELRESNISLGEFVTGIRMMGELIKDRDDNIYDNFSEHVLGYITEVLHSRNYRACAPKPISKDEELFWRLVTLELIDLWMSAMKNGISDLPEEDARLEAKLIARSIRELCDDHRGQFDVDEYRDVIANKAASLGMLSDVVHKVIGNDVSRNLAVDIFWEELEKKKKDQTKYYLA